MCECGVECVGMQIRRIVCVRGECGCVDEGVKCVRCVLCIRE